MDRVKTSSRKPLVVHIAAIEIGAQTGMGRVATHWRRAFIAAGYDFVHIGPCEVGPVAHAALFPRAAWRKFLELGVQPSFLLVHEPSAGAFVRRSVPVVTFSHGIERRGWELEARGGWNGARSLRTRLLYPLWRLRQCDKGVRYADVVLVLSREDARFVEERYGRTGDNTRLFRNGVYASGLSELDQPGGIASILFMGSWLARKGRATLVEAAARLHSRGTAVHWTLAGTGVPAAEVLSAWSQALRPSVRVIPSFTPEEERSILRDTNIVVLPSFFEGQPLALLQAMEAGRCCIASDCSGQKDFITHGETGYLHAPGDAEALADLIAACVVDVQMRTAIGRGAKASMSNRGWDAVSEEVVQLVESSLPVSRVPRTAS